MSEMLGNQYFMARKYENAMVELEDALQKDPFNNIIKKKLIVCYTQTDNLKKALQLFISVVREDVHLILNSDPIRDDCPCSEIIHELERNIDQNLDEKSLTLGILWLYCDINESIKHFNDALSYSGDSETIMEILNKLSDINSTLTKEGYNGKKEHY